MSKFVEPPVLRSVQATTIFPSFAAREG